MLKELDIERNMQRVGIWNKTLVSLNHLIQKIANLESNLSNFGKIFYTVWRKISRGNSKILKNKQT